MDASANQLASVVVWGEQTGTGKSLIGYTLGAILQHGNTEEACTAYFCYGLWQVTTGDIRRGQSLVVWAIREGRQAARAVDEFLMGYSDLPR